jgi:hypothetical protein
VERIASAQDPNPLRSPPRVAPLTWKPGYELVVVLGGK